MPTLLISFTAFVGLAHAADDFEVLPYATGKADGCVGDPVTPLCAIKTLEACQRWSEAGLCRAVGYTTVYLDGKVNRGFAGLAIAKLRIVERRVLTHAMIPAWTGHMGAWVHPDDRPPPWRPGDLALRVEWWDCEPDQLCVRKTWNHPTKEYGEGCPPDRCGRKDLDPSYVLRREGGRWRVLYEHFDSDDHGDLWDAFWNRK
ncbi:MAG: hypothetical protein COW30_03835 [Rhodospirillales bacterium CG15_BIG_FIL_POST_REV_8_21_14_020_66_15]|nr:MAG: hypothetical protein COW30_03835 [Rhodospirillales bacterium CG15_BIG_FIL_POST_REV_8_21_14_020_66_15]